jgi:hypothetical protein
MDPTVARRLWTLYEPIHAVTYFAPEVGEAWSAAGVDGFWRGYFAGRAAPLGEVPAEVVTATFFGFAPTMVARAIPSIWSLIARADALEVRVAGSVAALDAVLGSPGAAPAEPGAPAEPLADEAEAEAAALLRRAAEAIDCPGRPLGAANTAVAWPTGGARATLWHAATILREHRGDGHVAACVAADLSGLDANVLAVAAGPLPAERFQQIRGWTPEEWGIARARLADRGLIDGAGAITAAGVDVRASIEEATDAAAVAPWRTFEPDEIARLDTLLAALVARISTADVVPDPNPIGVPRPD